MVFSALAIGLVATFWASTAWLQRSELVTVDLAPSGPYRILSSAGPVEVRVSDADRSSSRNPTFEYEGSWLLFGPQAQVGQVAGNSVELAGGADVDLDPGLNSGAGTDISAGVGPGTIEISCHKRFPCRATSRLELPGGLFRPDVTIGATGGDVLVDGYAGDLLVATAGPASVFLGSVGGRITVDSEDGDVFGSGLTASKVEVQTLGGAVELDFAVRPTSVVVRSERGPVTIELPDGDYAVSVEGGTSAAINVGQAADADSTLQIHARGPVRIDPKR